MPEPDELDPTTDQYFEESFAEMRQRLIRELGLVQGKDETQEEFMQRVRRALAERTRGR